MPPRPNTEPREVVTCRLKPDLIKKLDAAAEADRRSRSEMIEIAVEAFLAAQERRGKK